MPRRPETTSRIMSAVRSRDSTAEVAVRRRLWANGLRYRLGSTLPGKPDIVFPTQRIAVFIDGDLWHGNSWRVRGLPSLEAQFPNRTEWWVTKVRRNMDRDREVNERLVAAGWTVLRYWESEALAGPDAVAKAISTTVRGQEPVGFLEIAVSRVERRRLGSVRVKKRRDA